MPLQPNKPYVWINPVPDSFGQLQLFIRCDCRLNYSTEYEETDAYIMVYEIVGSGISEDTRPTTNYNERIHTKITVKVLDSNDVPKGFCTIKPTPLPII